MSQFIEWIDWLECKIVDVESILLRSLVAIGFSLTFAQVIYRYVLNNPLVWTQEFILYVFVWIVMIGAAAAVRTRAHFSLSTLLLAHLTPRVAAVVSLIGDVAMAVFTAVLLVQGANMTVGGLAEQASSFSLSMCWFYASFPVGAALMLWHIFVRLAHNPLLSDSSIETDTGLI
jgi:TRAP-type C4-dicarboxylate transport system permease small subunit